MPINGPLLNGSAQNQRSLRFLESNSFSSHVVRLIKTILVLLCVCVFLLSVFLLHFFIHVVFCRRRCCCFCRSSGFMYVIFFSSVCCTSLDAASRKKMCFWCWISRLNVLRRFFSSVLLTLTLIVRPMWSKLFTLDVCPLWSVYQCDMKNMHIIHDAVSRNARANSAQRARAWVCSCVCV